MFYPSCIYLLLSSRVHRDLPDPHGRGRWECSWEHHVRHECVLMSMDPNLHSSARTNLQQHEVQNFTRPPSFSGSRFSILSQYNEPDSPCAADLDSLLHLRWPALSWIPSHQLQSPRDLVMLRLQPQNYNDLPPLPAFQQYIYYPLLRPSSIGGSSSLGSLRPRTYLSLRMLLYNILALRYIVSATTVCECQSAFR